MNKAWRGLVRQSGKVVSRRSAPMALRIKSNKMATSRQILANRRNAALSCGPKAAAGTAHAARHGRAAQPDPHVAHEEILNGLPPPRRTARVHPARRSLRQPADLQRGHALAEQEYFT